ncbi:MAG: dihydroneopterin aldolase [Legionellaceae bacterium]
MLTITELRTKTRIGVYAWEQKIDQTLLIDLDIPLDLTLVNNELKNTLDYSQLCETITTFVESNTFELIETAAEQIASLVKSRFNLTHLTLRVSKPNAIANARNVSVTLLR